MMKIPSAACRCFVVCSMSFLILCPEAHANRVPLDRLVMVHVIAGSIHLANQGDQVLQASAAISSPELSNLLSPTKVSRISKAFPEFRLSDTLGVARTGEVVRLKDYSEYYLLELAPGVDRDGFLIEVKGCQEVLAAEPEKGVTFWTGPVYPNDGYFTNGSQWGLWNYGQSSGTSDADTDATEAWTLHQGVATRKIAIIDSGVLGDHIEFQGRVSGDSNISEEAGFGECPYHGYLVAGVAGAKGGNSQGIAGVNWNTGLLNLVIDASDPSSDIAAQIIRAYQDPAVTVINASWSGCSGGQGCNPNLIRETFIDAYKMNRVTVAAMGNTGGQDALYPASMPQGVIAVGGTDRNDTRTASSTYGSHIDVVAPGDQIWSTVPPNSYAICNGTTSLAAAAVSGLASLLATKDTTLYNDDIQNIIQLSADDKGSPGKDIFYGWGRINSARALRLLDPPNVFRRGTAYGTHDIDQGYKSVYLFVPGYQENLVYWVRVHEIRTTVSIPLGTFSRPPMVWGRGVGTMGYSDQNPIFSAGWCDTIPGVGTNQFTLRTYVYEVFSDGIGSPILGTIPPGANLQNLSSVVFNWSALEVRNRVDPVGSFFVPQSGTLASPIEGTSASRLFRACPNNDGFSMPNNARIKVVVKNVLGDPIPNLSRRDIYVLLNGGTQEQGFIGDGADSIVANGVWNQNPVCPDLRVILADAPTNAVGETYVTFAGVDTTHPGVAVREPGRKWGQVDSEMPVYVLGTKLQGRLRTCCPEEQYVLRIKNLDFNGGLEAILGQGEAVTNSEFSYINFGHYGHSLASFPNHPKDWWADVLGNGIIDSEEFNAIANHVGHDCDYPNNP